MNPQLLTKFIETVQWAPTSTKAAAAALYISTTTADSVKACCHKAKTHAELDTQPHS